MIVVWARISRGWRKNSSHRLLWAEIPRILSYHHYTWMCIPNSRWLSKPTQNYMWDIPQLDIPQLVNSYIGLTTSKLSHENFIPSRNILLRTYSYSGFVHPIPHKSIFSSGCTFHVSINGQHLEVHSGRVTDASYGSPPVEARLGATVDCWP